MRFDVLTLFPGIFESFLEESLLKSAIEGGLVRVDLHNIRDWAHDRHGTVDDTPYGGGPGMLMTCQPVIDCFRDAVAKAADRDETLKPYTVYMSPKGTKLDSVTAKRLSEKPYLVILCGHYEGVDERAIEAICDEEISIGDYVLTGGEMAAAVLTDAVVRFVPGVLGSKAFCSNIPSTQSLPFMRGRPFRMYFWAEITQTSPRGDFPRRKRSLVSADRTFTDNTSRARFTRKGTSILTTAPPRGRHPR